MWQKITLAGTRLRKVHQLKGESPQLIISVPFTTARLPNRCDEFDGSLIAYVCCAWFEL
jgi:hypothetical protein